jgi:hypothetical protein
METYSSSDQLKQKTASEDCQKIKKEKVIVQMRPKNLTACENTSPHIGRNKVLHLEKHDLCSVCMINREVRKIILKTRILVFLVKEITLVLLPLSFTKLAMYQLCMESTSGRSKNNLNETL